MNISKKTYDVLELAKQLDGSNYNEIHIKVYGIISKVYEQGVASGRVQMADFITKELLNKKEEATDEEN
jgi:hypothetical protein